MFPFRFGEDAAETAGIFAHDRAKAFASHSAFQTPDRRVRVGGPVAGFLEPA